jgi:hypothetical protein
MLSGFGIVRLALRVRTLPPHTSALSLMARGDHEAVDGLQVVPMPHHADVPSLIVHVWTPVGSATDALPQPLVDRYVAAVDGQGVISTGHAALEVRDTLYISHYPATEIDHSPDDFRGLLRATRENDVPGRFQPSYAIESAGWCESTAKVSFERYDLKRLQAFWAKYRSDTTYNLTNRNCSSTVAMALEVALEGSFRACGSNVGRFVSATLNPELWVASQLRKHAEAMAWTPGLVLDYARALKVAIDPQPLGVVTLVQYCARAYRYSHAVRRRQPLPKSGS